MLWDFSQQTCFTFIWSSDSVVDPSPLWTSESHLRSQDGVEGLQGLRVRCSLSMTEIWY